jgi:hypothetical protein
MISPCGMCTAVTAERSSFLDTLREDTRQHMTARTSSRTSDFLNEELTMLQRAIRWYTSHLVQMSRACGGRHAQRSSGVLTARKALAMPLPVSLWHTIAEYAFTPCLFLTYAASVRYVPKDALACMLRDLCPESRGMWPVPRAPIDRRSHSTLRCPWIATGFVCPYLVFADKSYGSDVLDVAESRIGCVQNMRMMCRRIARWIDDDSAAHVTRHMEKVHSHVIEVQKTRRVCAFADYRMAISKRRAFFAADLFLGEPMRMRFGFAWGLPQHLRNTPVFVATAQVSTGELWECAVLTDEELVHVLRLLNTTPTEYQQHDPRSVAGKQLRMRVAAACGNMRSTSGVHRYIHVKVLPYGDGYRMRAYFTRDIMNESRPGSSLANVRFMCLPRTFHQYHTYKKSQSKWKHTTEVLPHAPRPMWLRTSDG